MQKFSLLMVLLVAICFRIYQLEPPGLWGDDAINGLRGLDVLDGKISSPFQLVDQPLCKFHAVASYLIAGAFWLFGPGPASLRIPGCAIGVLNALLLYGIASALFDAKVGVVAALFFATAPLQLNHEKGVLQIVLGEFFLLVALCAFLQGTKQRRSSYVWLAGVPLAGCLYTYHATKIAPLIVLPFVLGALCWSWLRWRDALALALVFSLCAVPVAVQFVQTPQAFLGRPGEVSLWPALQAGWAPLWQSLERTILIWHRQQGPEYDWFGIAADPALTPIVAVCSIFGFALACWWYPVEQACLVLWFFVGMVPAILSTGAPRNYRAFLAGPPLFLWAALPIAALLSRGRWLRRCAQLLLCVSVLIDWNYYFYRVYTNREWRWYQCTRLVEMAKVLRTLGPEATGYVLRSDAWTVRYETLAFLSRAWGLHFEDAQTVDDLLPPRRQGKALLAIDPLFPPVGGVESARARVEAAYPQAHADVRWEPPVRTWWFDAWWPLAPSQPARETWVFYVVP